jgi:Fe2+ or Zn2+ uptake regulation protein
LGVQEQEDENLELARLENAINEYLLQHPQAADTVEGVFQWWLTEFAISASREKISQALENLVQRGVVEKSELHDGSAIYALAPRKH